MKRFFWLIAFLVLPLTACDGCISALSREGGVLVSNQIDNESHQQIQKNALLNEGEEALVYYDVTISLDGSESYLITNTHIKHYRDGRTSKMALKDIQTIVHQDLSLEGDRITISDGNKKLIFTVAPFNGGDVFLQELREKSPQAQ